ncbi:CDP-diacylglycerol--serine O-phosphatidyltransferase [Paenibacillus dendritiformis]|uniref:CDP-diacylglycerol--serine O-phosphatidyltransferase n=1 Tax=Paenibacillus dendritiformis C454 TaxID=1131935 RepID=H3SEJ1_9BACL|nr:CDP-diacylglycerol--serine O-phosphatidyltransferase [Paenibacillus dendritiformis]EHQ62439.1 cdp-diacylglycerol/serine o-phosphatidyltransferase [Paenibacillus dendritiformis C454]PZM64881.1 CDP-diacylglycerol--serine O-phosphatidyltransferase [Paenibacillus dendritiformis]TDL47545.1 CDP-diacylglycerol--serine O-phosphatidyltransferase [Paenibacillus dendritiformis]WGU93841.1 CDP-diacylglycerol--serine O-phosphatidyltransferase [Paenibacillus dendritiformis]CAH8773243.1 CDP-diacylglycerol-
MITKSIPSLFTVGNLFLGIISIMLAFHNNYDLAALMIIIAMLLDGLDGRVARALNAQSEFGKELDSLSDVISFGVAPAFIMYVVAFSDMNPALGWVVTAIFPICGALRLARFNVKAGIPGYFIGLPIPAAGGVACTLALFHESIPAPYLIIAMLLLSYLMVSTVKYPNFKKVGISKKALWLTPFVIAAAVGIAVWKPEQTPKLIFVPLVLYALLGLKKNVRMLNRRRGKQRDSEEWVRSKHS